jgi:hemolysin activation/secretion protein
LTSSLLKACLRRVRQLHVWTWCAALSVVFAGFCKTPAVAQSFFGSVVTDPTVGVDRGSASRIRQVEETTGYLTFSTDGSEDVGPVILGFGLSMPGLAREGDQLDVIFALAGPSEASDPELEAVGLAYRLPVGAGSTMLFAALDHGEVTLGTTSSLAFGLIGERTAISLGVSQSWEPAQFAKVTATAEVGARDIRGTGFGVTTLDESLRYARLSVLYEQGVPLLFQRRFALAATKGFSDFGASSAQNPLSSTPGGTSDFLRFAFSAEASVPLSREVVANVGLIGQWSPDSLPASQRCGFATNSYARGFDLGFVNGDRCLGARTELAYNIELPDLIAASSGEPTRFTQAYFGVDFGMIANVPNAIADGTSNNWSSASFGMRTLRGNFIGEIAVTHILDAPSGIVAQQDTRLWLRAAIAF